MGNYVSFLLKQIALRSSRLCFTTLPLQTLIHARMMDSATFTFSIQSAAVEMDIEVTFASSVHQQRIQLAKCK